MSHDFDAARALSLQEPSRRARDRSVVPGGCLPLDIVVCTGTMKTPTSWLSHERYPRVLFALLAALSILLAIAPHDRADWLLENALLFVGVGVLVATRKALPLSRISYTFVFLFLCLHAVGAHYTYSLVPYDAWVEALTGRTLSSLTGWERNHFDRLVHLSYGLLLAYPAREVFLRVADVRGFWGYYLPLDVVDGDVDALRADRMGGGVGVRRRPRDGLSGHAG